MPDYAYRHTRNLSAEQIRHLLKSPELVEAVTLAVIDTLTSLANLLEEEEVGGHG